MSHAIWNVALRFIEGVRWPETVAAMALLTQAVILYLQWKILGRHGTTMEEHRDIARTQAETAKLIGEAIQKQGTVLDKQAEIMDEQFKFQRRIEAKFEREKVFDLTLNLHSKFVVLGDVLSMRPPVGMTVPDISARDRRERAWSQLREAILPCQKALITSISPHRRRIISFGTVRHWMCSSAPMMTKTCRE